MSTAKHTLIDALCNRFSIEQMQTLLDHDKFDAVDCANWDISNTEWRESLQTAINAKTAPAKSAIAKAEGRVN